MIFSKDPIKMRIEGNLLRACGTTLGADNGTGVATMLAIADDSSINHPPLELLFTVQEEVGLKGIRNFDIPDMDAVGISATATNAHTTKEDLYMDEVQPFWDLLLKVLQA